jgi:type VI secretion system protein ImpE
LPTIAELLQKGDLSGAMGMARSEVDRHPSDQGARFVLFELLMIHDDFDTACDQIKALGKVSPEGSGTIDFWLGLVDAERHRHRFLSTGQGSMAFLAKPPPWVRGFCDAAAAVCKQPSAATATILANAWKSVPTVTGWIDGVAFRSMRDADEVVGPFLEALVPGRWCWIPFAQISAVRFDAPRGFQDVIWRPAQVSLADGPDLRVWVPSLYSGTGARSNDEKLARLTTFEYPAQGVCRGYGQRDLRVNDALLQGILSIQSIVVDQAGAQRGNATS